MLTCLLSPLTFDITAPDVLQDLDMAGDLFTRAYRTSLASYVITDKFITTAGLSVNYNLLSAKLGHESDSCRI